MHVDGTGYCGTTALHRAAAHDGDGECVKLLLAAGACVNMADESAWTALHHAASKGSQVIVETLLSAGANVNAKTEDNDYALTLAAKHEQTRVVQLLLSAGAKADAKALYRAVGHGYVVIVRLLLDAGADVNAVCSDETALHAAARGKGNAYAVTLKALLAAGAHVNARNNKRQTPLHVAAYYSGVLLRMLTACTLAPNSNNTFTASTQLRDAAK